MGSKIVFLLVLAVLGAQAARIEPKPEPRDLRVVVMDVIEIVRIIGDKLETGIAEAQPIIEELEDELSVDLKNVVEDLLLKIKAIVDSVVDRVKTVEQEVTDAITSLEIEAAKCVSANDKELDALLDPTETALAVQINTILENNNANITNLGTQIKTIITNLDAATDKSIVDGVACVKKGSTTVKECLDANSEFWGAAVQDAAKNGNAVVGELLVFLPAFILELLTAIQPILSQFKIDADPIWAHFGECVQNL